MASIPPLAPPARRPPDRFYSVLQWSLIGLLIALWLFGRYGTKYISVPRPIGFRLIILAVLCMNLLWWSVADRRFARHVVSPRAGIWLRVLVAAFSVALLIPIFSMLLHGRMPAWFSTSPTAYMAAITIWHIGLMILMPIVVGIRLLCLMTAAGARRFMRDAPRNAATVPDAPVDVSRRALLKTAFASVPMFALTGGSAFAAIQNRRLQINRHMVAAPWLPTRLKGLTITQVSDLHVGRLYRPERLGELVAIVNKLNSDLIVVTGDLVDVSNDMLPPTMDALMQFEARHGIFACIGNHDEIDDRDDFIEYVRRRVPLLVNERATLDIDGEKLTIAGTDWPKQDAARIATRGHDACAETTLLGHDAAYHGPVIALAHHPHTWDALASRGVPLTLSGHTHGGQIMLTPPGSSTEFGAGSALFRYIRGFYERPGSTLFVNRGVGNWFPLRINSPAEVVQLQLY